ncbi:uncharacterized protein LOC123409778 [Hordeum vulgare subsp. vulgare]|uniref:DUF295 domain-containing protein n=1 Tax=Hordeum vulgare subsp. vulgare TaxID=112509 RepID=A0A8I7BEX4_HORVV|nr:uncharacterized protein LOC123409778 [Hordeum vulgare subsp. vulgare]
MIGRPASACGSVAAAREASLRLRHHGHRLRRDEASPLPRSAPPRRRALSPASNSVSDLRDALLHRLRLRRAAHASPPPPSAPRGIGPLSPACAAPEFVDRLDLLGHSSPPSPPSPHRVAGWAASASTAREALRAASSSGPPSPPGWTGQLCPSTYPAPAASTARVARRCCRRLGVRVEERRGPFSPVSASTAKDQESLGLSCRLCLQEAPAPLHGELFSSSISTVRPAPGPSHMELGMGFAPPLSFSCPPLLTHRMNSMAMLPSSLAVLPPEKPDEDGIPGPVLIITNLEHPRSIIFSPYTMRTFSSSFPVDTADVLYSNGYFFLLKEGTYVSVWEVKSEKRILNFHVGVEIEQGYFKGTPGSDLTVVLARQRIFAQVDVYGNADEGGGDADIVTEFWLRTTDGVWQQNAVVCGHLGIHQNALFWLSDDECLCSVTQDEDGLLHLIEWEGAVEAIGNSFSLIENLGSLYIVKSGGVLPNLAGLQSYTW